METPDPNAPIQTLTPTGRAPKSRIKDCSAAYQLYVSIKDADAEAARYRTKIQGLIDGNPPYRASDLEANAQKWRSNVNFREAESIIDTNAASIWELDMEVPRLITVDCGLDVDPQRPGINYNDIIAEEYTRAVMDWPDYFYNRMLCTKEMLVTGIGPMFWTDRYDWRPQAAKRASMLVPPNSKAAIGQIELIGIRHSYQAHELYAKIADEKATRLAAEAGWSTDLIREVIIRSAKNSENADGRFQGTLIESLQQQLKNNDFAASENYCNPIRVIQLLVKEYSGKVSRHIIYEDEELPGYLYVGQDEYDSMQQALCLFMWNIGDGYFKSVKGLGHRIYPHVELSNRFINSTVDGASMSSSFILEPTTGGAQKVNVMRLGPVTILPSGFRAIQHTFAPNLTGLIGVRNMLHQILNNNTGVYKKQLEGPELPERTATEVTTEERKAAKLEKNQISIHYLHLDALHKEMFRRLANPSYPSEAPGYEEAKAFRDRCKKRGVPSEALDPKTARVKAMRAIGNGSAVMHDMVTRELVSMAGAMDEIGRRNAMRDRVASLVGQTMVNRYLPEAGRDQIPTSEHSLAMLENNDIMAGQQVVVGVDQPHAIHWLVHLPKLMEIASAFMQNPGQVNLQMALPAMQIGLQHLSQHLQEFARDPSRKGQVQVMEGQIKELAKVFQQMQKIAQAQAQQAQQAQQQQQQLVAQAQQVMADRETQTKLAEIQKNFEVKMANMIKQNEIRTAKAIHSMRLSDMKAAADLQRKGIVQPEPAEPEPT
ncbi:MAG: hypothetical protein PHX05_05790 [Acidobacteriota bacterium]|nr:hypothetical protein [Acidobacteriota bacterium]